MSDEWTSGGETEAWFDLKLWGIICSFVLDSEWNLVGVMVFYWNMTLETSGRSAGSKALGVCHNVQVFSLTECSDLQLTSRRTGGCRSCRSSFPTLWSREGQLSSSARHALSFVRRRSPGCPAECSSADSVQRTAPCDTGSLLHAARCTLHAHRWSVFWLLPPLLQSGTLWTWCLLLPQLDDQWGVRRRDSSPTTAV